MKYVLFAIAAPFLISVTAHAGFENGNALYDECRARNASPNLSHCYSYLEGVVDTSELYRLMVGAPRCVPDHVTAGQIKDIVLNSLRHHPEKRQQDASQLAIEAIATAFKCAPAEQSK